MLFHHLNIPELTIKNALKLADNFIIMEHNANNPILKYIEKTSKNYIINQQQFFSLFVLKGFCLSAGADIKKIQFINHVVFVFPELPSIIIYFFRLFFDLIQGLRYFFSRQIVITCSQKSTARNGR